MLFCSDVSTHCKHQRQLASNARKCRLNWIHPQLACFQQRKSTRLAQQASTSPAAAAAQRNNQCRALRRPEQTSPETLASGLRPATSEDNAAGPRESSRRTLHQWELATSAPAFWGVQCDERKRFSSRRIRYWLLPSPAGAFFFCWKQRKRFKEMFTILDTLLFKEIQVLFFFLLSIFPLSPKCPFSPNYLD